MTRRKTNRLLAVDLFSGMGGMTLGLKRAGFNVVGAVELDALAAETYALNHPEVFQVRRDIQRISARRLRLDLRLRKGELDLLAACPPCQGFSTLRTLNGHRRVLDRRNDLLLEVTRFARA